MTQKERQKIIEAINCFLDNDPDKWVGGIDTLFELLGMERWSKHIYGEIIGSTKDDFKFIELTERRKNGTNTI